MIRAALIGYGAIAKAVERTLASHHARVELVGVLASAGRKGSSTPGGHPFVADVEELLAVGCDVAVECAGHDAVRAVGPRLLAAGVDLIVASVGALADSATEHALHDAAQRGGGRLIIPSGAIAGLDGIAAARIAGITSVVYRAKKPATAWCRTAAEAMIDLSALTRAAVFFNGTAREACARFPQNANVTAAIALAGLGFDNTHVTLEADPHSTVNEHYIAVNGPFGSMNIALSGNPLPENPKSSMLAPYSLVSCLLQVR